ncbi:MAG: sigma-70 family RNA polymerase sigma factor [Proteobacteria bacterium]|nr:sigma-70 family RNA polymerase sigma factor [Pseudomonadota bacterium]
MRTKPLPSADPLIDGAVAGDRRARRALVLREGPRVLALCRRLADDPDDAFQEVWARVFKSLDRFDVGGTASVGTWIRTIAHRHLVDRHRRGKVRGVVLPYEEIPAPLASAEDALARRQRSHALDDALTRLSDEQRRVVVGHHLGELSLGQLAEAEGVAIGTIKSRLHRGRAHLATLLASKLSERA